MVVTASRRTETQWCADSLIVRVCTCLIRIHKLANKLLNDLSFFFFACCLIAFGLHVVVGNNLILELALPDGYCCLSSSLHDAVLMA